MIRSILPAIILSSLVVSTAWALPGPSTPQVNQAGATNLIQIGEKNSYKKQYYKAKKEKQYYKKQYYKAEKKHYKNYYHGGRYWGHRYSYRPYGWQTLGCVAVGPVWYCP
jgi:hypothetical protein